MSQKIVVNFFSEGAFCFSKNAILRLRELGCEEALKVDLEKDKLEVEPGVEIVGYELNISRNDKKIVQVVEEMGKEAAGEDSLLKIVEIPDDVKWHIEIETSNPESPFFNRAEMVVEGEKPARIWRPQYP